MRRKVGDPFDDVPLDKVASLVMGQLARRDIWVTDVEIYELKRQKVSFRETKGGIVIKNKKFILDGENSIISEELVEQSSALISTPQNSTAIAPHNNLPIHTQQAVQPKRPIKFVILDDQNAVQDLNGNPVPVLAAIKKAGLQFRPGKRYPVYQEMDDPRDKRVDKFGNPSLDRKRVYMMWDEHSREVMVSQDYFVPADVRLERSLSDDPWDTTPSGGGGPRLMFDQQDEGAVMPELRRK